MRAKEFIYESREDVEGMTIEMTKHGHQLVINALDDWGNKLLGFVIFNIGDDNELDPQELEVMDQYRGQGIARVMYDYVKSKGYKIVRSYDQTDDGKHFWDKNRGEDARIWESEESNNIVYHGNQGGIHRELITPMWWTEDRDTAVYYATQFNGDGWIYSAKLTCKNPYVVKPTDETNTLVEKYKTLEQQGYDSIYDPRGHDWIPFRAQDIHLVGEPEYQEGEDDRDWES
jgi:GNAT superfamily N-acetyltransferase